MKRLIVAAVLLGAVIFLCMFGTAFVKDKYEKITEEINLGEEYAAKGEFEVAKDHFLKAEKIYIDSEQYMAAFVNHSLLDDIGQTLSAVAPLSDKDSENENYAVVYRRRNGGYGLIEVE